MLGKEFHKGGNMPKFLLIENSEIKKHISTDKCPDGFIPSLNFNGFVGEPISYYNEDWTRKDDMQLYDEGLKEMPKGFKLNKDKTEFEPKTQAEQVKDEEIEMPQRMKFNDDETQLVAMTLQELYDAEQITLEDYARKRRAERNSKFNAVDYIIERYNEQKLIGLNADEQEYILSLRYKQYLRDIPQQEGFPFEDILSYDNWI